LPHFSSSKSGAGLLFLKQKAHRPDRILWRWAPLMMAAIRCYPAILSLRRQKTTAGNNSNNSGWKSRSSFLADLIDSESAATRPMKEVNSIYYNIYNNTSDYQKNLQNADIPAFAIDGSMAGTSARGLLQ
jgi:hypothetical protein